MSNSPTQNTATETVTPAGCCGGPAPEGAGACCARDAAVKATGGSGCGCNSQPAPAPKPALSSCCG